MFQDAYGQLGRTVSEPPRPRTAPRPLIPAGPPQQAPNQVVSDIASANNANANANRTRAITPEEIEALRLQNAERRRGLDQGISEDQQRQQERNTGSAQIEALTDQFLHVADMYRRDFEPNDPMISLGLSPTERSFDRAAAGLTQQGFGAFRIPGSGNQSDRDAQLFAEANALSSTAYDSSNEEVLNNLQNQINRRRGLYNLPPVQWSQVDAVRNTNPNLVQPGESMGRVGNLPPLNDVERQQGAGQNELDNSGGMYLTSEDRQRADQIASHTTAMARRGATAAQINAWLAQRGISPISSEAGQMLENYRRGRRTPDFPGFSPRYVPTGRSDPNLTTGAANTGYGAGVIAAGDAMTFGLLDNATADPERTRAGMELLRAQHPVESAVGEGLASIVPGIGAERLAGMGLRGLNSLRGGSNIARLEGELATIGEGLQRPVGNAMYGAGYGAGSADEGNRFLGAARGAAMSAAGGEVGDRAMAGVGRGLTGARNSSVRYLNERGIPLTVGQIASGGGRLARTATSVENALESIPLLGDAIRSRRNASFQGVNRAAFDDALAPVNGSTGGVIGEEGVQTARGVVGDAYTDAVEGVRVNANNGQFVKEMRGAMQLGQRLPPDYAAHFQDFVDNRLAPAFQGGRLSGNDFHALRQELRQEQSAVRRNLGARGYSSALKRVEMAMERLVRRSAPEAVPGLEAADTAYRRSQVVRGAVGRAVNNKEQGGVFTPAQLGLEARANGRRFGGADATPERPFFELQRNAQNVLPSSLPNSGTADRAWVLQAFPAIASGTAYQTGLIDQKTAALFAGLGLPYTSAGQRTLQKLLVSRPEFVRRAGEAIISQRRWGGRIGAGAVNPVTDQTPSPSGR